ncbi:MAG: ribbon-helix-helix protein, CopG family [Acidobacteria bacterium]|nr:ribbon-helix-helix protein, CopG family [Acidobacteriota bacterium]
MKIKTSITLSEDILKTIDKFSGSKQSRSEFIEGAINAYLTQLIRNERNARDLEIINKRAEALNEEAFDVLDYQVNL